MSTQSEHSIPIVPALSDVPTMDNQNFQENIDHISAESEAPPSRPESPENEENFEPESEEEERNGGFYHREAKAESVAEYMYRIRDDTVKPRQFLGTDSEDGIEAVFRDHR